MSKVKFLTIMILFIAGIFSCNESDNIDSTGDWTLNPASITLPAGDATVALDTDNPTVPIRFEWQAATNDEGFTVTYRVLLDEANGDFSEPLFAESSGDNGKELFLEVSQIALDDLLESQGLDLGGSLDIDWAVEASAGGKKELTIQPATLVRFTSKVTPDDLFLAGTATEVGDDVANAIQMVELKDATGTSLNIYELYTELQGGEAFTLYAEKSTSGLTFGGADGAVVLGGESITAPAETGTYRVSVDFNTSTYEFLKIDRWSIVGNVIPGGWGGDEALEYQGGSVWSKELTLIDAEPSDANKRFIFRANGDWGVALKEMDGASGELLLESFANDNEITVNDIQVSALARYNVVLDLSAPTPSYSLTEVEVTPLTAPATLFILVDGTAVAELTKTGDAFSSDFVDLGGEGVVTVNSASDGSGTSYVLDTSIGSEEATGDKISGSAGVLEGEGALTVSENQAYRFNIDFATANLTWDYYNFKQFHWDPSDWDGRSENVMTYLGDYTWEVTADLTAGYNSKFITPWDFQFGSDSPSDLSGTLSGAGSDINNLAEDGSYTVTMVLNASFDSGTYTFVKQ